LKTAIMQPYLLPYIGYFQLINAVDQFVIYDDVAYIKNGWINRNRYLLNGQAKYFTLSLSNASSFKPINQTFILDDEKQKAKEKVLKTLLMAYSKAPFFKIVHGLIEEIILNPDSNIATYNENSIRKICAFLNINTRIFVSSKIDKRSSLKAQDRVIDVCKNLQASVYINAIGGKSLYSQDTFKRNGIELKFLRSNSERIIYNQFGDAFLSGLSIVDILMFNSTQEVHKFLEDYSLEG
jgi:hypothetical protein